MPRSENEIMDALNGHLDDLDAIARSAHGRYREYPTPVLVEHDVRAQAACTYAHMVAEADRRLSGREDVRPIEVRNLKLWLFPTLNIVVRFKKMDEDGCTRNYPTKQARDFDRGLELPGLPMPPERLTAGYLLDPTSTVFVRAQVAFPEGRKRTRWCAAIVPSEERRPGERAWRDVTRQGRL